MCGKKRKDIHLSTKCGEKRFLMCEKNNIVVKQSSLERIFIYPQNVARKDF